MADNDWNAVEENMTYLAAIEKAVLAIDAQRYPLARKVLLGALPSGIRETIEAAAGKAQWLRGEIDDAALARVREAAGL